MRVPPMTTRRWMAAVVVVASFLSLGIQAEKWARYAWAAREYRAYEKCFEEGGLTLQRGLLGSRKLSRKLMEAELAICATKAGQIAAIKAHLKRVASLIDQELNWPEACHDSVFLRLWEIAEVREPLLESETALDQLEGGIILERCVAGSRERTEEELASCATEAGQYAASKSHLSLHAEVFQRLGEIAETRETLLESEAVLNQLTKAR